MALQIYATSTLGFGVRANLGALDNAYVAKGAQVFSYDDNAMIASGSNQTVQVFGDVVGSTGISLTGGNGSTVTIGTAGTVTGMTNYGINSSNNHIVLNNYGQISGYYGGVTLGGDAVKLINWGTIDASQSGIAIEFYSLSNTVGSNALAINYGTVTAAGSAVNGDYDFGDAFRNFGKVEGDINQGGGDDTLLNRGSIDGNVYMDYGNDTVDNRNGTIEGNVDLGIDNDLYIGIGGTVTGTVYGGLGNDTMVGNSAQADTFDGGGGADILDFRTMSAVVLALDNSFAAAGSAFGDTYVGFEHVYGSNGGNDKITGDSGNNGLFGYAGNDTLNGGGGNDVLRGGHGIDNLTGGAGNDNFQFLSKADFGDIITDFSSAASGNNDYFQFSASIGGGLTVGVLDATKFQSRADNLAQDADDRFIFRTTDKTLWFDDDGNGAHAAVMVADLQASASMTAADIYII